MAQEKEDDSIDPYLREQILKFCAGDGSCPHYAWQICHHRQRFKIFKWLVDHQFVGKTFVDWLKGKHKGKILDAIAFVVAQLEHEKQARPIIFGKDWIRH